MVLEGLDLSKLDLNRLNRAEKEELIRLLEERDRREARRQFDHWFPDQTHEWRGTKFHARDLYPQHMEFFTVGAKYRQRCFMAGNRVGKSVAGMFEDASHLTGRYRHWWTGRVFKTPIRAWVAGKTSKTTRDILQTGLLGEIAYSGSRKIVTGTGMIPGELIDMDSITWHQGVANFVDTVKIKHVPTGEWSALGFKSYEQGRGAFEGTAQHLLHFDEEPPMDVYGEGLIRTMTSNGIIIATFTPLEGISDVVKSFLPEELRPED